MTLVGPTGPHKANVRVRIDSPPLDAVWLVAPATTPLRHKQDLEVASGWDLLPSPEANFPLQYSLSANLAMDYSAIVLFFFR